jgi:hypothetical protein
MSSRFVSTALFATLVLLPAAPVSAAFPNLTTIYIMSGVTSDETDNTATLVHCNNWSAGSIRLWFVVRDHAGVARANKIYPVTAHAGHVVATHETLAYNENDLLLSPGIVVVRGTIQILSTSPYVSCTASVVWSAAGYPHGYDLHLVRFNAWPGTVE